MSARKTSFVLCGCLLLLLTSGCAEKKDTPNVGEALAAEQKSIGAQNNVQEQVPQRTAFNPRLLRRFKPLRERFDAKGVEHNEARVELGRMLYYDTRLSKNHDVSCNSCHLLDAYGVDGKPTSSGHRAQRGDRNSPTVYNAAGYFAQFWDGRADTVEAQAMGPMVNPVEMALPSPAIAEQTIRSIPQYRELFKEAFPETEEPITFVNIAAAIGSFERGLTTPSRWDQYLQGDKSALTDAEMEGLKVFTNIGCMVCHTGELLGGSMFEKVGVVEPWPNQEDPGRYAVTKHDADTMMFKVPTLRNIAETAPYFHDGSVATLPEAVRFMGRHQLGLELTDQEINAIVTWLKALTGPIPQDYIRKPELPPSTPTTPKPSPV